MKRARVGLLTTRNHPLAGRLLERLASNPAIEPVLVFDAKDFSEKDRGIFAARTEGALPPIDLARFIPDHLVLEVPDHNGPECQAAVRAHGLQLLVNAGTPRRIKAELIASTPSGVLNVHPGILPVYRGSSCCEWALYNDDPVGVSAHFMDTGLDSGPIIFTRPLEVKRGQSYTKVRVSLYRLWAEACADAIGEVIARGLTAADLAPQPEASVWKPIPDALLDEVRNKLARGEYRHAR